ncbi:hypothetical protein IIA29_12855 [candidate division KSB1 bacterium]|nr:hypothetical protein [candidate division KSB1 bacterium]
MHFLGIESGGTRTTGVLVDSSKENILVKQGKPGNIAVLGKSAFEKNLRLLLMDLLRNISPDKVAWATFGIAGTGRGAERSLAEEAIAELGFHSFTLVTDGELLFHSVFGENAGVLICAGTGSVGIVRLAHGENKLAQVGGWGYLLGDEGSGFYMGQQAIRQALIEENTAGELSAFTREMLSFYQVQHASELVSLVHVSPNPQNVIAGCAELICRLADDGDSQAVEIVNEAARALVQLAEQAVMQLREGPPYKVSLAGGLLSPKSPIHERFKNLAQDWGHEFIYYQQRNIPAATAAMLAAERANVALSDALRERLEKTTY